MLPRLEMVFIFILKIYQTGSCEKQIGVPLWSHVPQVRQLWCVLSNRLRPQANTVYWIWRVAFLQTYTRASEGHDVFIVWAQSVTTETSSSFEVSINFYNSTRRHNTDDNNEHRKHLENLKYGIKINEFCSCRLYFLWCLTRNRKPSSRRSTSGTVGSSK